MSDQKRKSPDRNRRHTHGGPPSDSSGLPSSGYYNDQGEWVERAGSAPAGDIGGLFSKIAKLFGSSGGSSATSATSGGKALSAGSTLLGGLLGSQGSRQETSQQHSSTSRTMPPNELGGWSRLQQGLNWLDDVYRPGEGHTPYTPFSNNPFYNPDVLSGIFSKTSGGGPSSKYSDMFNRYAPQSVSDPGSSTEGGGDQMDLLGEWLRQQLGGQLMGKDFSMRGRL